MASIREQVVQGLVARLGVVSVGNGYSFSPTIYRAVRELLDTSLPAITVWDQAEETEPRGSALVQAMTVQIETMREVDDKNFSIIGNQSLADMKRALLAPDSTLGGIADGINLVSSSIEYPDSGTITCKTTTEIVVMYSEIRGDPDSTPL